MRRIGVMLDRDGVINRRLDLGVRNVGEFRLIPGVLSALRALNREWTVVAVITNQANLGRGLLTWRELQAIHERMLHRIQETGGRVDAVYVCPHRPDERCGCRKPAPGLLIRASVDLEFAIEDAYMVGDHSRDVEAARRAGCAAVYLGGREDLPEQGKRPATLHLAKSLLGASKLILNGPGRHIEDRWD